MNTYFKTFINLHASGFYWSTTPNGTISTAYHRILNSSGGEVDEYLDDKAAGMSVRCLQDVTTGGIENIHDENILKLYPNPSKDNFYIDLNDIQNVQMKIYNLVGECVMQKELRSGSNNVDVRELLNGIYIIQITNSYWSGQCKFTKE